jgi:hypothetical protein
MSGWPHEAFGHLVVVTRDYGLLIACWFGRRRPRRLQDAFVLAFQLDSFRGTGVLFVVVSHRDQCCRESSQKAGTRSHSRWPGTPASNPPTNT